jgi:PAS domain S-box-containing protein
MDADGRITSWNRAAAGIFGWTEAEALGAELADLIIPPKFRRRHVAGLKRFLATGEASVMNRQLELEGRRKDGAAIPIEMAITAIPDVDGWRFTALVQDISERKAETELFENAFLHAPIGYALVDLDGRLVKINDAFCRIVDQDPQTLLAMTFQDITHAEDLDRDLALLGRLTAGEIPSYQMDKRYLRRDGSLVWVNLSVSMVRHRDGAPKHYIAQVQDLTQRMEVEARYRLMAENSTDMITITEDGVTTFVSGACQKMVGRSPEQCLGLSPADYVHPEDLPALYGAFRSTAAGQTAQRVRWRGLNRQSGEMVWLESCPSLLDTGNGRLSFVDVVRDVTDQVAHEAELAKARADAEAAAAAKGEFLANMSHEIRTPLTAVIGFAGLLQEQPELGCEARRFADRIGAAAQALLALVNDILDFSKLEAGEVEIRPRPTDVVGMGREIMGLFQIQAEAKGLALDLKLQDAPDSLVAIDPQALRQVLFNLIGNAVKFTTTGGVTLTLGHADGALDVTVSDTGPGLAPEQQAKLFQRFSQVDGSSTRKHGGTGLGLAICKALVAAMGGEIAVDSQPGHGAAFHLRVPAPAANLPAASGVRADAFDLIDGARLLVADDNPVTRELARAMLEGLGAEVTEAADGLEAVETAMSLPFDAILMDLRMPALDGLAAAARIRADGPNQHAPILAFTANDLAEPPANFDGAVSKPVTVEKLVAAIAEALQPQPMIADGGRHVSHA